MKPPYFRVTSKCDSERCTTDTFVTERKKMEHESTSGATVMCTRQVCPDCRCWGYIIDYQEVTA